MFKGLLSEMFGLSSEATDPDQVERELGAAQSLRSGPRTEPGVRKWQDRSRRHTPSTASAQSAIDAATSVFAKNEADGATTGLRVTGDPATLQTLGDALEFAGRTHRDPDVGEWAESASEAIMQGARDGNVTLPPFKKAPGLEDFDDDRGPGPEEEH